MSKFLLLYRAPVSAQDQMANASPEQAQAGMDAWMAWAGKAGPAIVDLGTPTSPAGTLGAGTGDGTIARYSIMEADSAEALQTLCEDHPHLMMDGASIEILELLAMPGM